MLFETVADMAYLVPKTVLTRVIAWPVLLALLQCNPKQDRLPYYDTPDFTPDFEAPARTKIPSSIHRIGQFHFTDQRGNTVTDETVKGKIHVASFVFTHCVSICPAIVKHLRTVANAYAADPDVVFLSFSVMPWVDDVPQLIRYTAQQKITQSNWHFLTGDRGRIYNLARHSYFAEENLGFSKDSTEFLHTEHLLLVDKDLRIRGIYNGTLALETEQLNKDIELLKAE